MTYLFTVYTVLKILRISLASVRNCVKQSFLNFNLYLQLEYWLKQIGDN